MNTDAQTHRYLMSFKKNDIIRLQSTHTNIFRTATYFRKRNEFEDEIEGIHSVHGIIQF